MNKAFVIIALTISCTFGLKLNEVIKVNTHLVPKKNTRVNPMHQFDPTYQDRQNRPVHYSNMRQPLEEYADGKSSDINGYMFSKYPVPRKDGKDFSYTNPYDKILPDSSGDNSNLVHLRFLLI